MITLFSAITAAKKYKPCYVIRQTWPSEKMSPKLACLFEPREGKVKVGCKSLEQNRYQKYQSTFFSFRFIGTLSCNALTAGIAAAAEQRLHVFMFCISIRPVCKQQYEYTGMLYFSIPITL